jgi:hypothetical protein
MSLETVGWLFTVGVLMHNVEEWFLLPAWSQNAGWWHKPIDKSVFRFAVVALSLLLLLNVCAASVADAGSVAACLMAGWGLAMALNALFPHLLVSLVMKKYMPGTATGLLFNLPLGGLYLYHAVTSHHVELAVLAWAGPLCVAAIAGSIPLLFTLGRMLFPTDRQA